MPELIFVDSSSVEAIGYDSGSLELHVRFLKSGKLTFITALRSGDIRN